MLREGFTTRVRRGLSYLHALPDTSNSWHFLSSFIKNAPSLNIFKKRYLEFFRVQSNPIFGVNNPKGLKYLTRLRVGLSHLKYHKYHHNFNDTNTDACSCSDTEPETVEHFLLFCPLYNHLRNELFQRLTQFIGLVSLVSSNFTKHLLPYGYSEYDEQTNGCILELTINYILSSKRFESSLISQDR